MTIMDAESSDASFTRTKRRKQELDPGRGGKLFPEEHEINQDEKDKKIEELEERIEKLKKDKKIRWKDLFRIFK